MKKNKIKDDDGRTIAPMNVEGMPWFVKNEHRDARAKINSLNVSRKERLAMIKGALTVILPLAFAFIALFFLAFLFIKYVWLS